jgi:hypothetical protein
MGIKKRSILAALILTPAVWASTESLEIESSFRFPVKLHASEHFLFSHTSDFVDPTLPKTSSLMNEGRVRAEYDRFNFGVHFSNRFTPDGNPALNRAFVLEKKALSFESRNWTVTLGDSHQELGRGIALSLFRDEVFGLDNTVEGAAVRFTSNKGEIDTGMFAGRVRSLQAPVALLPFDNPLIDREVWLAALHAKARVAIDTHVGAHYLLTLNRPQLSPSFDKRWHTVGASFASDGILENVDVSVESNVLSSQNAADGSALRPTGYGTVAGVSYSPLPWKFQLEGKDYRGFNYEFQRPPSLEEDIVASLNNQDMSIARLSVWHNQSRLGFSMGDDRVAKTSMRHVVAQTLQNGPWDTVWVARAGYRWLTGQADLIHANISVKVPTGGGQSMEWGYRRLFSNSAINFLPTQEDRNYYDFTYTFSDKWNVGIGYEFMPTNPREIGKHYLNASTRVAFSGALQARAFVGQTSGGPQCSGGICRTVPAYTGGMLDVNYVF